MVAWAEIVRRHGPEDRGQDKDQRLPSHLAAMQAMEPCRPEALGGPLSPCAACGDRADSDHACKHRPCPTCQHAEATPWLEQPRELLRPLPSLLVTLTRPAALRQGARSHQDPPSNLLWQTSATALQALALAPHSLGGPSGMVGGLHTWTRDLASPPHVHALVPGGALSPEGAPWRSPPAAAWLVPVRVRSRLFRGKGKAALTPTGLCNLVPPQVWHQGKPLPPKGGSLRQQVLLPH